MKFPLSRFTIDGNSMSPTLLDGQDILSINWFMHPKVGDIVVLKKNGKEMIKRVQKIQDHEVIVQGDNEKESTDSRHFGPIHLDQVVGKVVYSSKP